MGAGICTAAGAFHLMPLRTMTQDTLARPQQKKPQFSPIQSTVRAAMLYHCTGLTQPQWMRTRGCQIPASCTMQAFTSNIHTTSLNA